MRAAVLNEDRSLSVVEQPDPTPAAGEAVVRVTGCGICGSDLHSVAVMGPAGTVLGHEIAGVVEAVGGGVTNVKAGDVVAVRPFSGCGRCEFCRAGRADHCASFALIGFQRPGGYAEFTCAVADELFALPADVRAEDHALVEPFAVARRGLRRGGLAAGESVVVLGAGPIGLAVTHWARALGAGDIVVSDPVAHRRELALQLGATRAVHPEEIAGTSAPLVVECSGVRSLIDQAMQLAAVDGRVAVIGMCLQPDTIFPWWGLNKELDVRFSIYYGREDFTDTIDAFADGSLAPDGFVTETIGLDAVPRRFAELQADADAGKVVIAP
ncbi:MAG TPA: alcohol dehydrogenase catalytic domain-containing protein [Acidimicrobiales bacterium]|nr:alcohol dehydrogenase catalytic domain-containing protein [Acidimicrobiales bacterium]